MTNDQMYEVVLMALCIWRESRNQTAPAREGVGCVIRNRVAKPGWWGNSYSTVILQPYQFSSFNANDPNSHRLPTPHVVGDWVAFESCMDIAQRVYNGSIQDPTGGAKWYHDTSITKPSSWTNVVKTVQLGDLIFYKEAAE